MAPRVWIPRRPWAPANGTQAADRFDLAVTRFAPRTPPGTRSRSVPRFRAVVMSQARGLERMPRPPVRRANASRAASPARSKSPRRRSGWPGRGPFLAEDSVECRYQDTRRVGPEASTYRELRKNANGAAREVVRRGRRRAVGSVSPRSSTIWQGARARGVERAPPAWVPTGRPRARRRVARRSCTTSQTRRSDRGAALREPRDLSAHATTEAGRPSEGAALGRRGSRDREALAHPPWDPAAHT